MLRMFSLILCSSLVSGCAITPTYVRENPTLQSQFEVEGSLQQVIKRISNKHNECRADALPEQVTLLDELGEANIEYRETSVNRVYLLVDLKKQNDKVQVAMYSHLKALGWERAFKTLEHGAKGLPGCP